MADVEAIAKLVNQLSKLPGIGRKTAQRLAYHIISLPEDQVRELAVSIFNAKREVHYCALCGDYTTDELCPICRDESRKNGQICVVSTPRDVPAGCVKWSRRGMMRPWMGRSRANWLLSVRGIVFVLYCCLCVLFVWRGAVS